MPSSETESRRLNEDDLLALPVTLNSRQVADVFGCTPQTVGRLARAGKIPFRKVGHSYIFNRDDVFDAAGLDYERLLRSACTKRFIKDRLDQEFSKTGTSGETDGKAAAAQDSSDQLVSLIINKLLS